MRQSPKKNEDRTDSPLKAEIDEHWRDLHKPACSRKAERALTAIAERGSAYAQWILAEWLESVPSRNRESVRWHRRAAAQGYALSMVALGLEYERGLRVKTDYRMACELYRLAARSGSPEGAYNLGLNYEQGKGVPRDFSVARRWFLRAATLSRQYAWKIGEYLLLGIGGPTQRAAAIRWLRTGTRTGSPEAQFYVGLTYELGIGVRRDLRAAARWYQKAIANPYGENPEGGVDVARIRLARIQLASARPVTRGESAIRLLSVAAEAGYPAAMAYLALCLADGIGTKPNIERAKELAHQASHAAVNAWPKWGVPWRGISDLTRDVSVIAKAVAVTPRLSCPGSATFSRRILKETR
jgi:TPR repeat protein